MYPESIGVLKKTKTFIVADTLAIECQVDNIPRLKVKDTTPILSFCFSSSRDFTIIIKIKKHFEKISKSELSFWHIEILVKI